MWTQNPCLPLLLALLCNSGGVTISNIYIRVLTNYIVMQNAEKQCRMQKNNAECRKTEQKNNAVFMQNAEKQCRMHLLMQNAEKQCNYKQKNRAEKQCSFYAECRKTMPNAITYAECRKTMQNAFTCADSKPLSGSSRLQYLCRILKASSF